MPERFSPVLLRLLRNRIPINTLITSTLNMPFKRSENYLRFLCPLCGDFHTATNPSTNLARCFRCQKNFNPIDMVMILNGCSFLEAVRFLETLLPSSRTSGSGTCPGDKTQPQQISVILSEVGGVRLKLKEAGSGGLTQPPQRAISCERKVPFI